MSEHEIFTRPASPFDGEINRELTRAMEKFGATAVQLKTADATHPMEAYETLRQLGADSELLGVVGSLGDLADDEWVLDKLHHWNTEDFPNG